MLKSLTLQNHECHRLTELEFSPGLNIFIGPTDAGKSSAFRAVYWLINNRPLGDQMLPLFWKGETKITVEFSDPDSTVSRIKGKKTNDYQLNNLDPVNAGSGTPPEEISQAIMLDDVNFQTQVDRSFMMFDSPGERGRMLNRIAGLEEIDKALNNGSRDVLRLSREYRASKANIKTQEEQLEAFSDLEKIEEKVALCEQFTLYIQQSGKKAKTLRGLIDENEKIENKLSIVEKFLPAEEKIKLVESLLHEIQKKEKRIASLNEISLGIKRIDSKLEGFFDFDEVEGVLAEIKQMSEQIEEAEERAVSLRKKVKRLESLDHKIEEIEEKIEKLEKALPKICKECGAGLK